MRLPCLAAVGLAASCASYTGTARDASPAVLDRDAGWIAARRVPFVAQRGDSECGAAAIAMVVSYWTKAPPATLVAELRPVPERGLAAGRLRRFARDHELRSFLVSGTLDDLVHELRARRPVLVGLVKPQRGDQVLTHYEVVVGVHPGQQKVVTLDPARGWRENSYKGFLAEWNPAGRLTLVVSAAPPGEPPAP